MKILRVAGQNYKGKEQFEVNLNSQCPMVCGVNRSGKTTVIDAVYDILTGKMSDGTSADNVRPTDEHGNDANNDPVIREMDVDFDGSVHTLRKISKKKFAKNRQTGEMVFKGNEDSYEIDGFPCKKTEFQKWLAERLDAEACNFCLNPKVFIREMQKNTVNARKTLLKVSGYKGADLPEYQDIIDALKGHTPDELRKVLNRQLKEAQQEMTLAQSSIKMLNELSTERKVEEPEEKAQLTAELERFQKCLEGKKSRLAEMLAEDVPDTQKIVDEQNSIVRRANESMMAERAESQKKIENMSSRVLSEEVELGKLKAEFAEAKKQYDDNSKELTEWTFKLTELENKVINVQTICPTCGQNLPADDVDKAYAKLKAENDKAVNEAKIQIEFLKKQIKYAVSKLKQTQVEYKALKGEIDVFHEQIEAEKKNVSAFPALKTIEDIPEAKALDEKVGELKKRQQCIDILNKDIRSLEDSVFKIERRIKEIDFGIEMKQREAEADKQRLSDQKNILERKQAEYGRIMGTLDRLKEYSMTSNRYLEDYINSFFDHFKFSLFGETQSGEPFETCQMLVDGIPYGNGLNHGDMILCEIDLARGFQKMMNVNLPIFVDDSESLDADRIPKIENQLIVLRRTDDKELVVTYG